MGHSRVLLSSAPVALLGHLPFPRHAGAGRHSGTSKKRTTAVPAHVVALRHPASGGQVRQLRGLFLHEDEAIFKVILRIKGGGCYEYSLYARKAQMNCELIEYGGWKRNIRVSNGRLELIITLDVGPRILHFGACGCGNVFSVFPEQLGRKARGKWMLWGGHRLWVAPEHKPRTYELDNGPIELERIRGGVRVVAPPGPITGLQKSIEIRFDDRSNGVEVAHTLTNTLRRPVECAPWALSVMAPRGLAILPLPPVVSHDDRVTPNQNWSLWSYTDLSDPRIRVGSKFVLIRQDPRRGPTKLGMAQREGWVGYLRRGELFVKLFARDDRGLYPDGNVNLEVYTDRRILELETLAPLGALKPGASATHKERWHLFQGVPACASERDVVKHVTPITRRLLAGQARSG